MVAAYILIDVSIDVDEPEALAAIRQVPGVRQAHLVVGPNDCIAYIEVDSHEKALETLRALRAVRGVLRTDMRSAAEL
ncbi:MAG: Lrp/AsnC ligand binding domain-containing protein [Anaerolineae bacterium]|nr:Lrp/AsnC ligand binding domain-containing protein [Anaerolineae bacterium]